MFPIIQRILQSPHVKMFRGHAYSLNELLKGLSAGVHKLTDIISTMFDEGVMVGEEVGPLQNLVQITL